MALNSAQERLSLNFGNISTSFEKMFVNMKIMYFDPTNILWALYSTFLFHQLITREIEWNKLSFIKYIVFVAIQWLVSLLHNPWLSVAVTVTSLLMHWDTVPSAALPANGKSVLITGCDRGIGHALAKHLDREGYQVFAGCLNADSLEARALVRSCSNRLVLVQMDVRDWDQVTTAFHTIKKCLGPKGLWAVVNNAGICFIGNFEIISMEDQQKMVNVNFFGALKVCETFLPLLRKSKGRLINIASNCGLAPVPHMSVYAASKAALAMLSESIRYELRIWGMHVSTIVPSGYRTGILAYDKQAAAERWWNSASATVKEDFGKHCFTPEFKMKDHESNTDPDLSSIVQTITTAVSVKRPKAFYYSGLLSQALPFAYTYLPPIIRDPVMDILANWFVFQPNALHSKNQAVDNCKFQ